MSTTTIIKSRSRGRFTVKGGRYISVSLDSLTHAQLLHAVEVARHHLGVTVNGSSVVRAAVALYCTHIDKVAAKRLEPVPEGAPVARPQDPRDESLGASQERLRSRERHRIKVANEGAEVPFTTMPAYVPGRSFAEVLAAGWRFKRESRGPLPCTDGVAELMREKTDAEQGAGQ
jgi:hypothetical protein